MALDPSNLFSREFKTSIPVGVIFGKLCMVYGIKHNGINLLPL